LARLRSLAGSIQSDYQGAEARQLNGIDPKRIFAAVKSFYGLGDAAQLRRHDAHVARRVAAWLCRRHTGASLCELGVWLGFSHADSVPNLSRWIETQRTASPELFNDLAAILKRASSPDAGIHQANTKRTKTPLQSQRPKTKYKG
jgi:chromosomal replication initiation ATPase DnaA